MRRLLATLTALFVGGVLALGTAIPASATEPETVEVVWLLPETVTELPTGNTPAIWPQTHLVDGIVPCGRFAQADVYTVEDAAVLTADGVLTEGEDYAVVISWRFIAGPVCPVETTVAVTVTPEVCDGDVGTVSLEGENVTWQIVNDFESAAGPAGTVIEGVPSGTYSALANGELAESADNPRVYGHTVFTAIADDGFTIVGDSVFEVDTVKAACAIVPPIVPPAPPTLASTGAESAIPLGIAGLLLFVGGTMFSLARRFRVVAESGE